MEISTRKEAALNGQSKYFTGKACAKGHFSPRYTSSGICVTCNAEGVKRYARNLRLMSNSKAAGHFAHPLHPDDHAAARAYCQALDMQRGRNPWTPTAAPTPPPFDAREARRLAFGKDIDAIDEAEPYIPKP